MCIDLCRKKGWNAAANSIMEESYPNDGTDWKALYDGWVGRSEDVCVVCNSSKIKHFGRHSYLCLSCGANISWKLVADSAPNDPNIKTQVVVE